MNLIEELNEYTNMWNEKILREWNVSTNQNNQINNSQSNSNTANSKLAPSSYKREFLKLSKQINKVNPLYLDDAIYDDWGASDHILRLYYCNKKGADFRLEVTTTKWSPAAKGRVESWDWVLEELEPDAKIIDRGPLKDYDHLLDKLIQYGVIKSKSGCK